MTATDTYLLLRAFCDELARCGLQHACTSPGSRNTPIVLSLVREPRIRCWSHIDERCAGFFAVGAAKAAGRPVAVTCTSGTAAANYVPAVVEAYHARVPLIVLTADRPPELREVGAGQAIDQVKLYGDAVKWFFEVGVDGATEDALRWMRQLACRPYWTASSGRPGPVHLNFPLREPLVLDAPLRPDRFPAGGDGRPWVRLRRRRRRPPADPGRPVPARGVVIAGRDERGTALARGRCGVRRSAPAIRCSPIPLSGARPARRRSPATTCCCARVVRRAVLHPSSSSASATCRPPSRCAPGCGRCRRRAGRARPRGGLAGPRRRRSAESYAG